MRLPLALTLAPVVLLCSFVVAAASMMQSAAAADPLSITLTAPTTCEADFDDRPVAPGTRGRVGSERRRRPLQRGRRRRALLRRERRRHRALRHLAARSGRVRGHRDPGPRQRRGGRVSRGRRLRLRHPRHPRRSHQQRERRPPRCGSHVPGSMACCSPRRRRSASALATT